MLERGVLTPGLNMKHPTTAVLYRNTMTFLCWGGMPTGPPRQELPAKMPGNRTSDCELHFTSPVVTRRVGIPLAIILTSPARSSTLPKTF